MTIIITVNQKGARVAGIESLIEKQIKSKYPDAVISVTRKVPAESRNDRFGEAQSLIGDAKSIGEELRDELQQWLDNLPENMQSGGKAGELESAVSELEDFINSLEEAEGASVDFPGMY